MDIAEKFILFIVVLQFVWSILEKIRGPQAKAQAEDFDVGENEVALEVWAGNVTEQLERAAERAEILVVGAARMERDLRHSTGTLSRVRDALEEAQGPLQRAADEITRVRTAVTEATPQVILEVAENQDHFQQLFSELYRADMQLGFLKELVVVRQDRDLEPVLADADTLADALLRQMNLFSFAHGLGLPEEHPICIPTERGGEAVLMDLFPRHPIVLVPPDFRGEGMRWVALAHEMGHVLDRYVPGFQREVAGIIGPTDEAVVPHRAGRRLIYDMNASFARWLQEIMADVFAALLLGPAALRGLIHTFQDVEDPAQVVTVDVEPDGRTIGPHPPRHLRIMWTGQLVETMGFITESKALLRQWDRMHGAPTEIILPTLHGNALTVPATRFLSTGHALVQELHTRTWRSLGGYTLGAVSGLEMTPGRWAKVEQRAQDLLDDTPFNDDPVVVIAAAVEALGRSPAAESRVGKGVIRAIVSDSIGERRVADQNYLRSDREDWSIGMDDVVDAIALRALWFPRGVR